LPIFLLRSRGFRVLQSFFFQFLGTVSPSSLPSSPRSLPEFRVFGPGSAGLYSYNPVPPLLHFDATLSVLPLRLPPSYRCPTSTAGHLRKAPRISSVPFSIQRSRNPSFHPPFGRRLRSLARLSEGSHPGLATLSATSQSLNPWKPLSAPHARGLRPSELSSPPMIDEPFRTHLSAPAFPPETLTASDRRFSGFLPPVEPYPFLLPEGLVRGGTLALLGLSDFPGSPSDPADPKSVSLPGYPFRSFGTKEVASSDPRSPKAFPLNRLGSLPPKRAPACLAFLAVCPPLPTQSVTRWRTIFSSRSAPAVTNGDSLLLPTESLPAIASKRSSYGLSPGNFQTRSESYLFLIGFLTHIVSLKTLVVRNFPHLIRFSVFQTAHLQFYGLTYLSFPGKLNL
jgi:hypothetical protein